MMFLPSSALMGRLLLGASLIFAQTTTAIALPILHFSDRPAPQLLSNQIRFPKADDRGAPVVTSGGGTRGETCLRNKKTILFPIASSNNYLTAAANPTLFVYLPEHRAETGKLLLLDNQGDEIYQTEVTHLSENTILAIALPDTVSLQPDQIYTWRLTLYCPSKVVEGIIVSDDFTEATITRVSLDTMAIDPNLTPLEQAQFYADNNLLNEVLVIIAPLRKQEPETWRDLLDYMDFGQFADSNLVMIQP